MIEMAERRLSSPILRTSTPSMIMLPVGSARRNRAVIMLDLPAPVRPTIPIFSQGLVFRLSPFSTRGSVAAYLNSTS